MSDKKHIDRLFQERFKDFEAAPSDAVWERIEANLNKKKKRRVIPIWWRYGGAAALLLLLLTIGGVFNKDNNEDPPQEVVETDTKSDIETIDKKPDNHNNNAVIVSSSEESVEEEISDETSKTTNRLDNFNSKGNSPIVNNKKTATFITNESSSNTTENKGLIKNNNVVASNPNTETNNLKETKRIALATNTKKADEDVLNKNSSSEKNNTLSNKKDQNIAENKKEEAQLSIEEAIEKNKDIVEKNKKQKRWSLAANAAPVYFNTLGQGSSLGPGFVNNSKSGEVNMSYGLAATYALNNRLKIRSGVNRVNLGYNTNNVIELRTAGVSARGSAFSNLDGVTTESSNENIASDSNVSIVSGVNLSDVPESLNATSSTLNQDMAYIEIPVEIQYALIDRKFGVNVIGGFSSFFLNDNSIYSESETGTRSFLGEDTNLNKVSYSANFGLGFNYKFTEKIDLNLEPMFKYQINTFNNTSGNFTPFIIGVYTGFAIKF